MKLLFDHIYRVLDDSGFNELKKILSIFPIATYEKKDTNYGFWEGIYIMANNGRYLEFIKEDQYWSQDFISACTSLNGVGENLHKMITDSYKHHRFKRFEINTPDGDPWMFMTMLEPSLEKIFFYSVEYRGWKKVERKDLGKSEKNWLKTIDSLKFNVNRDQFDKIPEMIDWFTQNISRSKDLLSFDIPTPEGASFKMIGHLMSGEYDKSWFKLTGKYDQDLFLASTSLSENELNKFKIKFCDGVFQIEYSAL